MNAAELIDAAGGRKFVLAAFFSVAATAALFTDHLDAQAFVYLTGLILGLYGAANVTQKVKVPAPGPEVTYTSAIGAIPGVGRNLEITP